VTKNECFEDLSLTETVKPAKSSQARLDSAQISQFVYILNRCLIDKIGFVKVVVHFRLDKSLFSTNMLLNNA
jgi:hypothetical protein